MASTLTQQTSLKRRYLAVETKDLRHRIRIARSQVFRPVKLSVLRVREAWNFR
ncbi:hypothetical protein NDI49_23145 [Trichocoleus sp. ST-U3]|uniref:hypothetical protein n=1 Tax=Coleofasciculus sp. FACHB-542 TaxID=2692787 RepID=UPI001682C15D|nr:hypothetical protein [Coleofasciculus sp. FACHB-542]MBD2087907.1 hypothetical protein [Coleofasciculus sp. FACHB-542]